MPWKKVNVSLEDPEDSDKNHYDSEVKVSSKDLPVEPGEQIAIFNGLEVLSGDSYKVEIKDGKTSFTILDESTPNEVAKSKPEAPSKAKEKNREANDGKPSSKELAGSVGNDEGSKVRPEASSKIDAKKKKKKKKKTKKIPSADSIVQKVNETGETSEESVSLQSSWCGATGGVLLHSKICDVLLKNAFWTPTPIQAATLPASVLGRCDILGAAPTGSGKTLAYILPIVQHLLEVELPRPLPLQALILAPTRELALQVEKVGKAFASIGCIVGGLAQAKQARVLDVDRPAIVVGTVGRLWELVSFNPRKLIVSKRQRRILIAI